MENVGLFAADDIGIDESLEIVVAMVVDLRRDEDVLHTGKRFQSMATRLVVHHTDAPIGKLVETVYATTELEMADG